MKHSINLKSDFELPATAWSYRKEARSLTITAEAECLGVARRVCSDIELALEYGAFPAAHALMIEKINQANRESLPLSCVLSFGS